MSQLRIGIIGCGGIANAKHLPALANMNDLADMTPFCDIIPDRAELAAKQYGAVSDCYCSTGWKMSSRA